MPLAFQTVDIPFVRGMNTKIDPKLTEDGVLLRLENGVFRQSTSQSDPASFIRKRYGTRSLSLNIHGGSTNLTEGAALDSFRQELLLFSADKLYSRNDSGASWIERGDLPSFIVSNEQVIRNSYSQDNCDSATDNGVTLYAWTDSRGGVRASVIDEETGAFLLSDVSISTTGVRPRCLAMGSHLWVFFVETSNLRFRKVSVGSPTAFGSATTIQTTVNATNQNYDIINKGAHAVCAFYTTTPNIRIFYLSNTGVASPVTLPPAVTLAEDADGCICIASRNNETEIYVAYHSSTLGVRVRGYDAFLIALFAAQTLDADTTTFNQITGINSNVSSNKMVFFYQKRNTTSSRLTMTKFNTVSNTGTAGTTAQFKRQTGLAGKAFEQNAISYVLLTHESDEQSTYFLVTEEGKICARLVPGAGGGLRTVPTLAMPITLDTDKISYAVVKQTRIVTDNSVEITLKGIQRIAFQFSDEVSFVSAELGDTLHIVGGQLWNYDGLSIVEHGFHLYPEGMTVDDLYFQVEKIQDGTAGTPEISNVSLMHGDKIEGGQHWLISSPATNYYIWYRKDGVGTDPAVAGRTGAQVDILSTDTAAEVAQKTKVILDAIAGTPFVTTRSNYTLTITNSANNNVTDTANGDMGLGGLAVVVTTPGSGGAAEVTTFTFPDATYFVTGEYLFLNSANDARQYYAWFNKDSAGGDPKIDGKIGIEVAVATGNSANTISGNFATAINVLADFSATNVTGTTTVTNLANGATTNAKNVNIGTTKAGALADGVYGLAAIYYWENSRGEAHRSAPFFGTARISNQNNRAKITLEIPPITLTEKQNVTIQVFRTEANGSIWYRTSSYISPIRNNDTVDKIIYTERLEDAAIIQNELLYTTGGIVEHIAPRSCSFALTHNNRVFIKTDRSNELWYSKDFIQGEGLGFNEDFSIQADPEGKDITALGSLDNYLIIFKENLIRAIAGSGPNAAGQQNDFSADQLVTSDVGCSEPNSVVSFDKGLLFKSKKGIYMIDRSLQVSYIGDRVEAFNSEEITSGVLLADLNEIRFTTRNGPCLVYNYFYDEWSVFSNFTAEDAIVYDNTYHHLKSTGLVKMDDASVFDDDGTRIVLKLETSWIKLGQIQGFKRIRRSAFLGNYRSSHTFKVDISYDYQDIISDSIVWSPDNVINTTLYGSGTDYGSDDPYGGTADNVWQFRVHNPRQKCQAIKYILQDQLSGTYGESYSLSALSLEIAGKQGLNRMRAGKSL